MCGRPPKLGGGLCGAILSDKLRSVRNGLLLPCDAGRLDQPSPARDIALERVLQWPALDTDGTKVSAASLSLTAAE